ncbi:hypothetical protein ACH5RR_013992 [Cinchona calisaya]|uniref:Molybdate-anion transporter n=1 Tax=Cinchona calisaya TaxID=153742 RepID=A0ABD3A1K7_9GENT
MAVVIESDVWEPNKALYIFTLISCFVSIYFCPHNFGRTAAATVFDHSQPSSAFHRFHRSFLLLFSLSSVVEGLGAVFGEYEWEYYYDGVSNKEQMLLCLFVGCAASLCIGTFLGVLSDLMGPKKVCLLFYLLHLFVSVFKSVLIHPSFLFASFCLSLASSILSFSFETWMVVEVDKLGQRQDTLNEMFWLMTFVESASFIGSQFLGNWLIIGNRDKTILSPHNAAGVLAVASIIYVARGSKENPRMACFTDYCTSFRTHIFSDKRIWMLSWSQACVHFSIAVFWILWAPTIVADGREVQLGLIYPCLMGARMLGSTAFPWFFSGTISIRTEECLLYVFPVMGLILSVVAYDYQDIGVLLVLFFLFHACVGLALPSLARLRSMYVPNELRGGMISLSQAPANVILLLFLILRGYYRTLTNSTIIAFAGLSLFSAAGCMYMLKRPGKQLYQNWHKL